MDNAFWQITLWSSIGAAAYVYAGYPLLLWILNAAGLGKRVHRSTISPKVTLIISAYNEESVILSKLQNTSQIDYPVDLLEIIVVSDCSSDRTDSIVEAFAERPVTLLRLPERRGKTFGLNLAVEQAQGEIIIFSDANAMYEPASVANMVRNFADPRVGAVTGESRYRVGDEDPSTESEDRYWAYELWLKKLESRLGSLVGGDGAIMAIRKNLHHRLHPDDLSDFINPMQVVIKGFRNVYESEAVCYEGGATGYDAEFRRKVRIVNRAWRAMWKVRTLLNPFRYGFFSLQFLSHKILRWLIPVMMILTLISSVILSPAGQMYRWILFLQLLFYAAALMGYFFRHSRLGISKVFVIPYYFCIVNIASLLGIIQAMFGIRHTMWNVSRSESQHSANQ